MSDEIHEIFPYLNAVLKGCIYNHPALTLTIRNEEKLITLHTMHVTMTLIENEKEANEILNWLKDLINETYQKKGQIEPSYSEGDQLKPSDIQKLLPGRNCKECGFQRCQGRCSIVHLLCCHVLRFFLFVDESRCDL